MKKLSKIFAVALCLALALSLLPMGAAAAAETVTMDFTALNGDGKEIASEAALEIFQKAGAGDALTAVALTKVYAGNSSTSGAFPSNTNMLKTGTGSLDAEIAMTFAKKVTKIEITCHDWYSKSDNYPTNHNFVSVNGSAEKLAPYTTDSTLEVMTFEFAATDTVKITTNNDDGKGGRIFITKMVVTFEETTTGGGAGNSNTGNTGNNNTGNTGNTGNAGGNTTQKPDDAGDNTAIVAMTSVMAVAVVALAVLVVGKKKFF